MTTSKYLILNNNKLNQHCFKRNFIRPRQNYFSHWNLRSQNCGEWLCLALVELGRSSRAPSSVASGQGQLLQLGGNPAPYPTSTCATLTLAERRESKHTSYLHSLQCSSLQDKGGNPQALPVKFNFIPQNTFKELIYSRLSNHDSMKAWNQLNSWPAP